MIRILGRRWPLAKVVLYPAQVQGQGAAESIAHALTLVNAVGEADVILCGRGGGSMEDLWAFNEESVARAIAASGIPVISAVGHEPDVTIADFVADLRAPTPSGAAEMAVPDRAELSVSLRTWETRLYAAAHKRCSMQRARLTALQERLALRCRYSWTKRSSGWRCRSSGYIRRHRAGCISVGCGLPVWWQRWMQSARCGCWGEATRLLPRECAAR